MDGLDWFGDGMEISVMGDYMTYEHCFAVLIMFPDIQKVRNSELAVLRTFISFFLPRYELLGKKRAHLAHKIFPSLSIADCSPKKYSRLTICNLL